MSTNSLRAGEPSWLKGDLAPLVLRLGLAAIFIVHGYIKVQQGANAWWNNTAQLPPNVQAVVAWGELVAGGAMLLGLLTRLAALGVAAEMVAAVVMVTGRGGFAPVTQPSDPAQPGLNFTSVGYEYNLAIFVICLALIILGSGGLSLDHCLFGRRRAAVRSQDAAAGTAMAGQGMAR